MNTRRNDPGNTAVIVSAVRTPVGKRGAQLAQFSSLEQLTGISAGLESLTEVMGGQMLQTMHATSAMGALGRTVLAQTDQVELGAAGPSAVTVECSPMRHDSAAKR